LRLLRTGLDDDRCNDEQQFTLDRRAGITLEQVAKYRHVAEQRRLVRFLRLDRILEAAQHQRLAALQGHVRGDLVRVDGGADGRYRTDAVVGQRQVHRDGTVGRHERGDGDAHLSIHEFRRVHALHDRRPRVRDALARGQQPRLEIAEHELRAAEDLGMPRLFQRAQLEPDIDAGRDLVQPDGERAGRGVGQVVSGRSEVDSFFSASSAFSVLLC